MALARPPKGGGGKDKVLSWVPSSLQVPPGRGSGLSALFACPSRVRLEEDSGSELPRSPAVSAWDSGCPGGCPGPLRAIRSLRGCHPGKLLWRGRFGAIL